MEVQYENDNDEMAGNVDEANDTSTVVARWPCTNGVSRSSLTQVQEFKLFTGMVTDCCIEYHSGGSGLPD